VTKCYIVGSVIKRVNLNIDGYNTTHDLELTWNPGQIGVCAVFATEEDANKFAGDRPVFCYGVADKQ